MIRGIIARLLGIDTRPHVGPWQPDPDGYDESECLYDERGQMVGGHDPRPVPGYRWWALRPFARQASGDAATASEARARVLSVLETWCDVSAARAKGVRGA